MIAMSGFASIRMWVIGWIAGLMLFTYSFPVGEVINKVVTTIPHDDKCFTQGLVYDEEGNLYESCGLYGKSSLRIVDRSTGRVKHKILLPRDIFAEGLTLHNNVLYLLTWKNKKMFMYSKTDLAYLGVRKFETSTGEGWGLTTDGHVMFASDGSETISVYKFPTLSSADAADTIGDQAAPVEELNRYKVYDPITGRHLTLVNELEYHNGFIYANIWYKDVIIRFNATTGRVQERYDAAKIYPKSGRNPSADCLNGIAYDPKDDTMLLTGKRWPKYYKVNFTEMDVRRQMEL
jgi:glutamine cyclotransferase